MRDPVLKNPGAHWVNRPAPGFFCRALKSYIICECFQIISFIDAMMPVTFTENHIT